MNLETIKEGFLKAYVRYGTHGEEGVHTEEKKEEGLTHSGNVEKIGTSTGKIIKSGTGNEIKTGTGNSIKTGTGINLGTGNIEKSNTGIILNGTGKLNEIKSNTGSETQTGTHSEVVALTENHNNDISGPSAFIVGYSLELLIVFILIFVYRVFPKSKFSVFFDLMFEKVYDFFEDLFGKQEKKGIKIYVTTLFFIIILSNLLGVCLEFLFPIFGEALEHNVKIPSAEINFNMGMAIISILVVLFEQSKHLGFGHFVYEYFPIFGKNYIPFERGKLPIYAYIPLFIVVKVFDIIISVFLGLLEIVGFLAKIISLSFRLFGNITSGSLLLVMVIGSISSMTASISPNFEFPVLIPILVYLQESMVALIQAFVFPLLIAIFVKVAKIH